MKKNFSIIGAVVAGAFMAGIAQSALAEGDVAKGEKLYQREGCLGCHGASLEGSAAYPNLLTSPKTVSFEEFNKAVVLEGKGPMAMFKGNEKVKAGIADIYVYLESKKKK